MKNNLLRLLGIMLLCILLISCSGKDEESTGVKNEKNSNKEKIKIKVGVEGDYPPYTFTDENGKMTGYDIDVMEEIARRRNLDVEFIITPWDGIFLALESGKFDLLTNLSKTSEREQKYDFTDDYLISGAQIIVKKGRTDIKTLEDLKGKKVLICLGCNYQKILTDFDVKNEINAGNYEGSEVIALEEISNGKIDATIHDRLVAAFFNKKKGTEEIQTVGDIIEKTSVYFVFRKDQQAEEINKRVNKALEEMKADGTLSNLSKKWFNEDFTK